MSWSSSRREGLLFVAVGGANTLLTYLVYLAILHFASYVAAYVVSYVAGIAFSYVANSVFVFRAPLAKRTVVAYPLAYMAQFALGLGLVALQVELLGIPAWAAPWIALAFTVPVSFVATRFILRPRNHGPRDDQ